MRQGRLQLLEQPPKLGGGHRRPVRLLGLDLVDPGLERITPAGELVERDQPGHVQINETFHLGPGLLKLLQAEERRAGRTASRRWGPRPLDLDLLFHGPQVLRTPELEIPHPRLAERTFVLGPLREVAPHWRHPVTGATAGEMLAALEESGRATRAEPTGRFIGELLEVGA